MFGNALFILFKTFARKTNTDFLTRPKIKTSFLDDNLKSRYMQYKGSRTQT